MLALSLSLVVSSARAPRAPRHRASTGARSAARSSTWLALAVVGRAACKLLGFVVSFALLTYFIVAVMYRRPRAIAALVAIALARGVLPRVSRSRSASRCRPVRARGC